MSKYKQLRTWEEANDLIASLRNQLAEKEAESGKLHAELKAIYDTSFQEKLTSAQEKWRPLVMKLVQRLISDGDHSEEVDELYELCERTASKQKDREG